MRNVSRFDGRTDLTGEKAGAYLLGVRTALSPIGEDFPSSREVGQIATSLRITTVRSLLHMATAAPRTRIAVAAAVPVVRNLHEQVMLALESA